MGTDAGAVRAQRRDVVLWLVLSAGGLLLCAAAVTVQARIGTAGPPFLGRYQPRLSAALLPAVAVAAGMLLLCRYGVFERMSWPAVLTSGYLGALGWALALASGDGAAGVTRALHDPDGAAADIPDVGTDPYRWLRGFTTDGAAHGWYTREHPPGPVLLLWAVRRLGVDHDVALGLLVMAVGALTVPLVLYAVGNSGGEVSARRYLPVLVLAPYAVWAGHPDALVATLGAAMIATGVWATRRQGWQAAVGGLASGALLGVAALFSYAAAWLGLSVICVYFARRRPLLNVLTGLGALVPVLAVQLLGFNWMEGIVAAQLHYAERVGPHRAATWWAGLSVAVLLLLTGPALVASLRKVRNTPGWPFLVGAAAGVVFPVFAGVARGGVEHAWLAFYPWLTVAAVAPQRQAGPPVPAPLLLAAVGAATGLLLAAVLDW